MHMKGQLPASKWIGFHQLYNLRGSNQKNKKMPRAFCQVTAVHEQALEPRCGLRDHVWSVNHSHFPNLNQYSLHQFLKPCCSCLGNWCNWCNLVGKFLSLPTLMRFSFCIFNFGRKVSDFEASQRWIALEFSFFVCLRDEFENRVHAVKIWSNLK